MRRDSAVAPDRPRRQRPGERASPSAATRSYVLAGQTDVNGDNDFAILKRKIPGGDPDPLFNATGPVPGQFLIDICGNDGNDMANTIVRLPDDKFLVGGTTDCLGSLDFAIARLTYKGVLDPKFTNSNACPSTPVCSPQSGVILIDFGGNDVLTGLWGYSNTKWFASGYSDANGTNDIAFTGFQSVNRIIPGFGGQGTGWVSSTSAGTTGCRPSPSTTTRRSSSPARPAGTCSSPASS